MIVAKSTETTVVFRRANGDVILRKRPVEPRLSKSHSHKVHVKVESAKVKAS